MLPNCPKCNSSYTYEDMGLFICPECFFEWTEEDSLKAKEAGIIRDSNGNELSDGDTVSVIKDMKVKGASQVLKRGTIVKNISLIEAEDGHDISCKIDGFGGMYLKSSIVKKI